MNKLTIADRIGAACGAAYVLLILIGNSIAVSGESNTPTGTQVLRYAQDMVHSPARQLGTALEVRAPLTRRGRGERSLTR